MPGAGQRNHAPGPGKARRDHRLRPPLPLPAAAEAAAEVFAGNNIPVILLGEDAPTPLITYRHGHCGSAYGLAFTASHNPPEWNGLKVFHGDGALLLDDETRKIEAETNALTADEVIKLELDIALDAGIVQTGDFTNEYVDAVEALIDLQAIRNAGLKVIVDPMYGVGQLTLGTVLTEARCRVTFIHERHNPLFGGRSPAPNPEALRLLTSTMHDDGYDLGLAMDGDADRIAIVDELGEYISINDVLLLLYWYMHEVRGERGGVVRNLATTHLLDRLAHALARGVLRGAGRFQAHRRSDGGAQCAAGWRIVRRTDHSRPHSGQRRHLRFGPGGGNAGPHRQEDLAVAPDRLRPDRQALQRRGSVPRRPRCASPCRGQCARRPAPTSASYPVVRISHMDGTKLYLENDNWALLRFSGTEPVLRLTVEADSPEKANELLDWLKQFVAACK